MLDKLLKFLKGPSKHIEQEDGFGASAKQLAQAALMFHVIAADGIVAEQEKSMLLEVLQRQFGISAHDSAQLMEQAKHAHFEATDLYQFTSILNRQLSEQERSELIESLWTMVYADGIIHELEDNVVWRMAELLHVENSERMAIKRKIRNKLEVD